MLRCLLPLLLLCACAQGQGFIPLANPIELYGQGCPGNDGVVPLLYPETPAAIGNSDFRLIGDPMPAGWSNALLFYSSAKGNFQIGAPSSGCNLLLDIPTLGFTSMTMVGNQAEFALPVPFVPAAVGVEIFLQMLAFAPAPDGVALSPGLALKIVDIAEEYGTIATLSRTPQGLDAGYHDRLGGHAEDAFNAPMEILPLQLAGAALPEQLDDASRERVDYNVESQVQPEIILQDVGRMLRYEAGGQQGFMVSRADTGLMLPIIGPELGTGGQFSDLVPVSPDGRLMAALQPQPGGDQVRLATTDLSLLGVGNPTQVISPQPPAQLIPETLVFIPDGICGLGFDIATGLPMLYIAPLDGSAPMNPIPLPLLGTGLPPLQVDPQMLIEGDSLAFIAFDGTSSDLLHLPPGADLQRERLPASRPARPAGWWRQSSAAAQRLLRQR